MTNSEIKSAIGQQLVAIGAAPVLFVGSGLSRRYLCIPTWPDLLQYFANYTDKGFDYYRIAAGSNWPRVASLISNDFFDVWWKDDRFLQSRNAVGGLMTCKSAVLKYEISKYIAGFSSAGASDDMQAELDLLRNATIESIITTNWDAHLESLFPDYTVFVGQEEMMFSRFHGTGEIYKIHGCCSTPDGLVLTDDDYQKFQSKNVYLAAKVLTLFVDHPIVFLGYSLSDEYIVDILNAIASCVSSDGIEKLQGRLIFVDYAGADEVPSVKRTVKKVGTNNFPYTEVRTRDFRPIYEAFAGISRKYSAKILRRLKDEVYQLVRSVAPTKRLAVIGMDEVGAEGVEVVFGVGILEKLSSFGYRSLSSYQLATHCLTGLPENLDYRMIVQMSLPDLLRGKRNWVPVRRFVFGMAKDDIPDVVHAAIGRHKGSFPTRVGKTTPEKQPTKISDIVKKYGKNDAKANYSAILGHILNIYSLVAAADLRDFLTTHIHILENDTIDSGTRSLFMKLVCLLDCLEFPEP